LWSQIKTMKKIIIIAVVGLFMVSCNKTEHSYLCRGKFQGSYNMWKPNAGNPMTAKELKAANKKSEDLGYTDITCEAQ
jgi:hypothetical protein